MTEAQYYVPPDPNERKPTNGGSGGGGDNGGGGGWQPIPPFQPANYTFGLRSYKIHTTRSRDIDTNTVSLSYSLEDGTTQTVTKAMGHQEERFEWYFVGLTQGPFHVSRPDQVVSVVYMIVNSGHDTQADINRDVTQAGNNLAQAGRVALMAIATGVIATTFPWGVVFIPYIGNLLNEALVGLANALTGVITADCDGVVAAETVIVTGQRLWENTYNGGSAVGRWTQNNSHPGHDSPVGCGSNSRYETTFEIVRH